MNGGVDIARISPLVKIAAAAGTLVRLQLSAITASAGRAAYTAGSSLPSHLISAFEMTVPIYLPMNGIAALVTITVD